MTAKKSTTAAAQFAELGIPESDWTPAMQLAVKQKWGSLPVTEKVDVLRARIAAVKTAAVPDAAELAAANPAITTPLQAEKEIARLKRNAAVTAWRARNQLQAALDARDAKFAAMRARRGKTAPPRAGTDTGDLLGVSA